MASNPIISFVYNITYQSPLNKRNVISNFNGIACFFKNMTGP